MTHLQVDRSRELSAVGEAQAVQELEAVATQLVLAPPPQHLHGQGVITWQRDLARARIGAGSTLH